MTEEKQPLKVSYCITCKGRLHHLKETLPANLSAEKDNPNVEFVLLDYDSPDGLQDWIKAEIQKEGPIKDAYDTGKLKYVYYAPAPYFKMAHAKNMAHRMASGDVLCNLDADNAVSKNFSQWLCEKFKKDPNTFVSLHSLTLSDDLKKKYRVLSKKQPKNPNGSGGRIAVSRENFERLAGYDERFSGHSPDDINFSMRARDLGLHYVELPTGRLGTIIDHDINSRIFNLSPIDQQTSHLYAEQSRLLNQVKKYKNILTKINVLGNADGNFGCGTVYVNFSDTPTVIDRLCARKEAVSESPILENEASAPIKTDWLLSMQDRSIPGQVNYPSF